MTPVLCYVSGNWAYFTTQALKDQRGDDWNDAPYEHNAGSPYTFHSHDEAKGIAPWEIICVAFEADMETPDSGHGNSPYSVKQINAGAVAWLRRSTWASSRKQVYIHAGVSLRRFCDLIRESGGTVYLPMCPPSPAIVAAFAETNWSEADQLIVAADLCEEHGRTDLAELLRKMAK